MEIRIWSSTPRAFLAHCFPNGRSQLIRSPKSLFGSAENGHWEHNEAKNAAINRFFFPFRHSFGHGWATGDNSPKLRLLPVIEKSENQTQTPACYVV